MWVTVDSGLSWLQHVTSIASKLGTAIFPIREIKQVVSHRIAKLAFYANFYIMVPYAIII